MKKIAFILSIAAGIFSSYVNAQTNLQSTDKKVSSKELQGFYDEALNASKVNPGLSRDFRQQNQSSGVWMWRCDAWPAVWNIWGNYYYWISSNVYYSRYRAVNACSYIVGFECMYRCYAVQI